MRLVLSALLLGLSLAQKTQILELTLLIQAEEGILFNHISPVIFTLRTTDSLIEQEAKGIEFIDNPEVYWETLNPVVWHLELPHDAKEIEITANLALCDKQQGFCYIQPISIKKVLDKKETKETIALTLHRPEY